MWEYCRLRNRFHHGGTENTEEMRIMNLAVPAVFDESKLIEGTLTKEIIGAAIEVHRHLGPGLLESSYEVCICHELAHRALGSGAKSRFRCSTKEYLLIALTSWTFL
jgi:hypothetical protein